MLVMLTASEIPISLADSFSYYYFITDNFKTLFLTLWSNISLLLVSCVYIVFMYRVYVSCLCIVCMYRFYVSCLCITLYVWNNPIKIEPYAK